MTNGRVDKAERKSHYGDGKQPWDTLCEETPWAVAFAAGNVLKYLRRPGKQPLSDKWFEEWFADWESFDTIALSKEAAIAETHAHSIQSARWYYQRLKDWAEGAKTVVLPRSTLTLSAYHTLTLLHKLLTPEEWELLTDDAKEV